MSDGKVTPVEPRQLHGWTCIERTQAGEVLNCMGCWGELRPGTRGEILVCSGLEPARDLSLNADGLPIRRDECVAASGSGRGAR